MIEGLLEDTKKLIVKCGWKIRNIKHALTGSYYIEICRINEYCLIRLSDHHQEYHSWFTTYSLAPGDLFYEQLEIILNKPYGQVGDIIE